MQNLGFFYDTETTGLPLFREPSEHPGQPHLVQLAAALVDLDTRETVASLDVVVRPDGWTIPDDVAAVHGITTDYAAAVGVPESLALSLFLEMGWAPAHCPQRAIRRPDYPNRPVPRRRAGR